LKKGSTRTSKVTIKDPPVSPIDSLGLAVLLLEAGADANLLDTAGGGLPAWVKQVTLHRIYHDHSFNADLQFWASGIITLGRGGREAVGYRWGGTPDLGKTGNAISVFIMTI